MDVLEPLEDARAFARKNGLGYTILMDADAQVAKRLGISPIPVYIVVDKEGMVQYHSVGSLGGCEDVLNRLVREAGKTEGPSPAVDQG